MYRDKIVKTKDCLPFNYENASKAKELRKNMTKEEKKLWYDFLRGYELKFQRQKLVDNYILDFYCAKVKLGIELDGSQHFTQEGLDYDEARTKVLNKYGLEILRFSNLDIMNNFEEYAR